MSANDPTRGFIFATGIECSYPTTEHGRWRRDEMDVTRHYELWREDFELAREVGITHIRYGPPLHLIFTGPGNMTGVVERRADGASSSSSGPSRSSTSAISECRPGSAISRTTKSSPALSEYARAFAERYPWVRFYTPVNEMYVCARFSALDGLWNEQLRTKAPLFARSSISQAHRT